MATEQRSENTLTLTEAQAQALRWAATNEVVVAGRNVDRRGHGSYPIAAQALRALERRGLMVGRIGNDDGHRWYRITEAGREALARHEAS